MIREKSLTEMLETLGRVYRNLEDTRAAAGGAQDLNRHTIDRLMDLESEFFEVAAELARSV